MNNKRILTWLSNCSYPTMIQNSLQVYDPETDTWSLMAPLPVGVFWATTSLTTGLMAPKRIYVFGGCNDTSFSRTNLTQVYNPENDSWTTGAPLTFTHWNFAVANVNDLLYVFGGVNYTTADIDINQKYTPIDYGTISSASPSPSSSPSPLSSPSQSPNSSLPPLPYETPTATASPNQNQTFLEVATIAVIATVTICVAVVIARKIWQQR